jgi:hypothetical protein
MSLCGRRDAMADHKADPSTCLCSNLYHHHRLVPIANRVELRRLHFSEKQSHYSVSKLRWHRLPTRTKTGAIAPLRRIHADQKGGKGEGKQARWGRLPRIAAASTSLLAKDNIEPAHLVFPPYTKQDNEHFYRLYQHRSRPPWRQGPSHCT